MLRFGTVTSINPKTARARVQFAQDNMTSFWLPVLQTKTFKDKFYSMFAVGEQVACLMDETSEDGVILGAIYTTEDTPIIETEQQVSVNFEDGAFANVNKETQTLTLSFPNIHLIGNIVHEGTLSNSAGITSSADITDKKSSMQAMRNTYNNHTHPDKNQKTASTM